jgi:3-oxoacyl-[acyl-carrier protein] reductase
MTWDGQVALVTGGSRGIGRAIARKLAAAGAAVGINYTARAADAEEVAREIESAGGRAVAVQADVGEEAEVGRMVERVASGLGPITILVNNAGIMVAGTLETYDPAAVSRMRRTNIDGVIHTTRAVMPAMKAAGYGRIVNVASIAAYGTTLTASTFYAATKAEVVVLTRRFAFELARTGITVNAVAPGYVATDMTVRDDSPETAERLRSMAERSMVGRVGEPDDISNAVTFLAAPDASFITAQTLTVDGGRMDYLAHPS